MYCQGGRDLCIYRSHHKLGFLPCIVKVVQIYVYIGVIISLDFCLVLSRWSSDSIHRITGYVCVCYDTYMWVCAYEVPQKPSKGFFLTVAQITSGVDGVRHVVQGFLRVEATWP